MKMRVHWGVAVAVFYTAFALSTVGFVAFAMTRDVDLVSDDYYAQALAHDRHMQAVANGDALGDGRRAPPWLRDRCDSAYLPRWCRECTERRRSIGRRTLAPTAPWRWPLPPTAPS